MEKLLQLGSSPITFSDSSGYVYDEAGITPEKLAFIKHLKNVRRGRVREYVEAYPEAVFTPADYTLDTIRSGRTRRTAPFRAPRRTKSMRATRKIMVAGGVRVVTEGANMPTSHEGVHIFLDNGVLFGPGKAANAGGVSVSGLEMTQNSMRLSWTRQEVDDRLKLIMKTIHKVCMDTAATYGKPFNYVVGANIAGFVKVADAMLDQGVV
jgi:glutamate dehydrogenase (NADP+)